MRCITYLDWQVGVVQETEVRFLLARLDNRLTQVSCTRTPQTVMVADNRC